MTSAAAPNVPYPRIIQGGMGAGVSSWRLAQAVSRTGQLGVVSGTALDQILARRLQNGDPGGHLRRALDQFPFPTLARRVKERFFIEGGKPQSRSYAKLPMHTAADDPALQGLCIVANFVEIFLAREGHANPVGINYLEKIQIPHLPSIYGAMLAGVDYVLMGAGVPLKIPEILDRLVRHEAAEYPLHVAGAAEDGGAVVVFDPRAFAEGSLPPLTRPRFIAIVSSNVLASALVKKTDGRVDGFVIEGATAGGHNAPPRGKLQLDADGEPIYGERDHVDLEKIRELDVPFWLAGGYGTPEKLREAEAAGAAGVQVGTAFAFCEESDFHYDYKRAVLDKVRAGDVHVSTDVLASPTNFPFKVVALEGTLSDEAVCAARPRICDLGYLRETYATPDGRIGYRCPAEPVNVYVSKGGKPEDTVGRKCICNALLAAIGLAQVRKGRYVERGLITSGNALPSIARFMPPDGSTYPAETVVRTLLEG